MIAVLGFIVEVAVSFGVVNVVIAIVVLVVGFSVSFTPGVRDLYYNIDLCLEGCLLKLYFKTPAIFVAYLLLICCCFPVTVLKGCNFP